MTGKIQVVFRLEALAVEPKPEDSYTYPRPSNNGGASAPVPAPLSSDPSQRLAMVANNSEMIASVADLRKSGMAMEITILEIDSFELRGVHTFSKNSPFVSIACGKFTETTKVTFFLNLKQVIPDDEV